jgi:hypothetical protein
VEHGIVAEMLEAVVLLELPEAVVLLEKRR